MRGGEIVDQADHDSVVLLKAEIAAIKCRLEGNVPERCVRVDSALQQIRQDIESMQGTLQWIWRTLAAAAVSLAAAAISSRLIQ